MKYEYDTDKAQKNLESKKLNFEDAGGFDWDTALVKQDTRKNYGEVRMVAYGMLAGRLTAMVYTERDDVIRLISWRKANKREVTNYEKFKD